MIITIDGHSGSGKSTAGKILAKKLGFCFLSSGEIYRAIAFIALKNNINIENLTNFLNKLNKTCIAVEVKNSIANLKIDGKMETESLHTPEISTLSAQISPNIKIRDFARSIQHQIATDAKNIVIEGRDTGSIVFPNADYKFFITASLKERAKRRFAEYKAQKKKITLKEIEKSLAERDEIDSTRKNSPLTVPEGAIVIDNTHLTADQTADQMFNNIKF